MTTKLSAADERFLDTLREIFADEEAVTYMRRAVEDANKARHRERMAEYHRHRRLKMIQGLAAS